MRMIAESTKRLLLDVDERHVETNPKGKGKTEIVKQIQNLASVKSITLGRRMTYRSSSNSHILTHYENNRSLSNNIVQVT